MMDFIFGTLWGWWGVAGIAVLIAIVVGYFVPSLRLAMLGVAGVVISSATIYTKGNRDRAALEKRRQEEAVRNVQSKYDAIDKRPRPPGSTADKLRDGSF